MTPAINELQVRYHEVSSDSSIKRARRLAAGVRFSSKQKLWWRKPETSRRDFSFHPLVQTGSENHIAPIQWEMGTLSRRVNLQLTTHFHLVQKVSSLFHMLSSYARFTTFHLATLTRYNPLGADNREKVPR